MYKKIKKEKIKKESIYIRAICTICNITKQGSKGKIKGKETYMAFCYSCNDLRRGYTKSSNKNKISAKSYRKNKKLYCEQCKFIAIHSCQLDVDHIDGNHTNDEESNLQTLCSNCHRLKTFINKEGAYKFNIKRETVLLA